MKPREVDPWFWYQCCQAPHEFHWAEHDVSSAIVVGRLQRDDDVAVIGKRKALLRNSWPRNVPAQALKLLALIRLTGDTSMQRKASLFGYQVVTPSLFSSDRDCL